ncbi:sporulation protein [Metabacillus arenae]|uniref:Sporulation protein n=1 Tax=Metabacillus arenae TaxID=2771434 RepID=A0A926RZ37_9BACI|nr:sporulation protein [Metabacillus arenae]MBD1383628.1 sporulation protein [Metabacillus arenae]
MLLRKIMSKLGIGSAKIDLILNKETYRRSDIIEGVYKIQGGTIEQKLKRIESELVQTQENNEEGNVILTNLILTSDTVFADHEKVVTFSCKLPGDIPLSNEEISYKFVTRLVFDDGVDSLDHDKIEIIA